jgi:hypothetical protein
LDRLSDRQEQSQRSFQDQVTRITDAQNLLLRDAILAMKAVEKSQDSTTETVRGIEKTVATLQLSVAAIDMLVRRAVEVRPAPGIKASSYVNAGHWIVTRLDWLD